MDLCAGYNFAGLSTFVNISPKEQHQAIVALDSVALALFCNTRKLQIAILGRLSEVKTSKDDDLEMESKATGYL